jgi:2-dehydro-3-deoxyphosphogluconate aldolase / (4S)-4-hydroxy-2-oxoglutarate aldolase
MDVTSAEQARYAAEAAYRAGIPIAEITMTVPGALGVIPELLETRNGCRRRHGPRPGNRRALGGCRSEIPEEHRVHSRSGGVCSQQRHAGALTLGEVIQVWKAGADFVKIFPGAALGGDHYIRALKAPFPQIPLVAAGGVNQRTALDYILVGASALGVGGELILNEALERKQEEPISRARAPVPRTSQRSPEPPSGVLGI